MEIRCSTPADLPAMTAIYAYARRFMAEHCGTIYVVEDEYPRLAFEKVSKR